MTDDIKLPPLPRLRVPLIEADVDLLDIKVLAQWCERTATDYARAAVLADRDGRQQDKLDAAVDAALVDAERYRLLRKGAVEDVAVVRGLGAMDYGMSAVVATYSEEIDGDDLDAAIEAALARENRND